MAYQFEIFLALIAVLLVFLTYLYRQATNSYNFFQNQSIPGPKPGFILGTWSKACSTFLGTSDIEKTKEYGKILGTFDGITPNLLVTNLEIIQLIVETDAHKFENRQVKTVKNEILRNSLLSVSGQGSEEVNKLLRKCLDGNQIAKILLQLQSSFNRHVQLLSNNISQDGGKLDITNFTRTILPEIVAMVVYNIDLGTDSELKEEFVKYFNQISTIQNPTSILSLFSYLYECLLSDFWLFPRKSLSYFINLTRRKIKERPHDIVPVDSKKSDLIGLLVSASEEERKSIKTDDEEQPNVLNDEILISECLSALVSLSRAPVTTISLSIYLLSAHEDIQEKLYQEVRSINFESETVSLKELQDATYLNKFLSEVLRFYPTQFRLERTCKEKIILDKIQLDAGCRISIPIYALHHTADYYPNHEQFDPERFDKENLNKINKLAYLPFGGKLSNANITYQLTILTLKCIIANLVSNFKFAKINTYSFDDVFVKGITGAPEVVSIEVSYEKRK